MKEIYWCQPQTCLVHEIIQTLSHLQNKRFSLFSSFFLFSFFFLLFFFFDNHVRFSWLQPGSSAPAIKLCENSELGQQGSFVSSCQQRLVLLGTMTTQVCTVLCAKALISKRLEPYSKIFFTKWFYSLGVFVVSVNWHYLKKKFISMPGCSLQRKLDSVLGLFLLVLFNQFSPAHSPWTIDV